MQMARIGCSLFVKDSGDDALLSTPLYSGPLTAKWFLCTSPDGEVATHRSFESTSGSMVCEKCDHIRYCSGSHRPAGGNQTSPEILV
jgi:hypothetical protein